MLKDNARFAYVVDFIYIGGFVLPCSYKASLHRETYFVRQMLSGDFKLSV